MQAVVRVKNVETMEELQAFIEERFNQDRYPEITQAIGMHSVLMNAEHMLEDQALLYRRVLDLLKTRIRTRLGKRYATWYSRFPEYITFQHDQFDIVSAGMVKSRLATLGSFRSLDDFFFWGLEDRRLELGQIVRFAEKTAAEFK